MPRLERKNIIGEHGAFSSMFNSNPRLREDFFAFRKNLKAAGFQPARRRTKHDFLARRLGGKVQPTDGCSKKNKVSSSTIC